jgi:glycosyltransferase involved in cell wall biosynthesis
LKIIHCLDHYLPFHSAGTEYYVQSLAVQQQLQGHEVIVLTPHFEYYHPLKYKSRYEVDGINVRQYLEMAKPGEAAKGVADFVKHLEDIKPDIIHFHEFTFSIGLGLEHVREAKKTGAKIILTMHQAVYSCYTNTLVNNGTALCDGIIDRQRCTTCFLIYRNGWPLNTAKLFTNFSLLASTLRLDKVLPKGKIKTAIKIPVAISAVKKNLLELTGLLDRIIVLSKWYKEILIRNGVDKSRINYIPQGLTGTYETFAFKTEPIRLPVKLLFVGRLQPQKGLHLLLEAMKRFKNEQVLLDVYGKEEYTAYYKTCMQQIESLPNVKYKGLIQKEDVIKTMRQYDVLCLPSTFSEMSPLVIQEASAAGIPVIGSEVYGISEQVEKGKQGWLFKFNDIESLKQVIDELVAQPDKIEEAGKWLKKPISFEQIAKEVSLVYNN